MAGRCGVARDVGPWGISVAGLLRLPVLLLYVRAIRRGTVGTRPPGSIDEEIELGPEDPG